MTAEIVLAFVLGWLLGTWMSWRKILGDRRRAERTQAAIRSKLGKNLHDFLKDIDVIKITVTEEGENELTIDQAKLDEMLGNKDRKH